MKQLMIISITVLLAYSISHAHDKTKAEQYRTLYANCAGKEIGKELFMVTPKAFIDKLKQKEDILVLDVRTKAEVQVIGITSKNVLSIPINKVFEESSLSKLPTDKPIIVVCSIGHRSGIVTMGLRDIGFDNVFILKNGIKSALEILTPKLVNQ